MANDKPRIYFHDPVFLHYWQEFAETGWDQDGSLMFFSVAEFLSRRVRGKQQQKWLLRKPPDAALSFSVIVQSRPAYSMKQMT